MESSFDESLLITAFENSNIFIGIYNIDEKNFDFLNNAALKILKISSIGEYIVKYPNGFKKTKLINLNDVTDEVAFENATSFEEEIVFSNQIGEEYYGLLHVTNFIHNNKKLQYFNITKIKYASDKGQYLKDQENRFEALFMHAAIGILLVNKAGEIVQSNRFNDAIFEYSGGDLINQKLDILLPASIREKHKYTYDQFTESPKIRPMGVGLDLNGCKKDGTLFPVEISLSYFTSGETQYYICFINDLTFKKKAEQNLINKNLEIQKLNESLENEVVKRTQALVETLKSLEKSKQNLEVALEKEKELGELKIKICFHGFA